MPLAPSTENMQPVLSAGKHGTSAKRGKTGAWPSTIGFGFDIDWLKNNTVALIINFDFIT